MAAAILRFDGQISTYKAWQGAGHPCLRCIFPAAPSEDAVPSCAQAGVLGALAGTLGALQATEVVKEILGVGRSLSGPAADLRRAGRLVRGDGGRQAARLPDLRARMKTHEGGLSIIVRVRQSTRTRTMRWRWPAPRSRSTSRPSCSSPWAASRALMGPPPALDDWERDALNRAARRRRLRDAAAGLRRAWRALHRVRDGPALARASIARRCARTFPSRWPAS